MTACLLCPSCRGGHGGSLCDLAGALTTLAGRHLEMDAASDGRLRVTEEGISYSLVRAIEGWLPSGISVRPIEISRHLEGQNGADLEIWLDDRRAPSDTSWFGWRIQAKRARSQGSRRIVPDLDRMVGSSYQCQRLLDSTAKIVGLEPIYWVYGEAIEDPAIRVYPDVPAIHVVHAAAIRARIARPEVGRRHNGWSSLAQVSMDGRNLVEEWCLPDAETDQNPLAVSGQRLREIWLDHHADEIRWFIELGAVPQLAPNPRADRAFLGAVADRPSWPDDKEDLAQLLNQPEKLPCPEPPAYVASAIENQHYQPQQVDDPTNLVVLQRE